MRAKRKRTFKFESSQNECAQMSNGLESARAMVVNLELFEPMVLVTLRPRPSRQVRRRQTRSEDHVSGHLEILHPCFLFERGLRFRTLVLNLRT
jgi:hypothetical protein